MIKRLACYIFVFLFLCLHGQGQKNYSIHSPNGKLSLYAVDGTDLQWAVTHLGDKVIAWSKIGLQLRGGPMLGKNAKVVSVNKHVINQSFKSRAYKKDTIPDQCNEMVLSMKGNYGVIFRAYNDGVAYRFFTKRKDSLVIGQELAEFNFEQDYTALIPHVSDLRGGEKYSCSFEEFYTQLPVSRFNRDTLGYLPSLVMLNGNVKTVLLEADVQDYPAMFVRHNERVPFGIEATFAPYPVEEALGGFNRINYMVKQRADYIAKTKGTRNFPWRILVVSEEDKELLNNDMVQRLSAPSKIQDASWIRPGKVAWDWWNDWNISHVNFKAGINTPTYKYYIDFAAANQIEYVVLDEGWSDDWDLNKLTPAIDLSELLSYAKEKNVGLILWSTWYALSRDIDALCAKYAAMGVKGFKVDFLDRNDQLMIASSYEMASIAAKHKLLLDFHGMFPPQGLQRTWPNVINFEGVRGMEYMKWSADDRVPQHELNLPFIRMVAGPMDYTPGAMRNATRGNARPSNSLPMSMGTRCHQMAMYTMYEAPLQMLDDSPTAYIANQECTDFIAKIPTSFDETLAIDGKVGQYAVIARRKNDTWYIAAMTNWTPREITFDLSFLKDGNYQAEIFSDGLNAGRDATDYKREMKSIAPGDRLRATMQSGGGWTAIIRKK
jgi:alpha-glucosidase